MRSFGLGCLVAAAFAAGGCFQMTTVVTVKGDGSGTIDHSMLITKAALAQLRSFAVLAGGRGQPPQAGGRGQAALDLTSEDQARAMAATLGPGVTYVSSTPIDTPLAEGRRSTYAFADISQVRISQQPNTDGLGVHTTVGSSSGDITCTFAREANGNATVRINLPEMQMPDVWMRRPPPDSPSAANPAMAQQLAMVRALLAGARITIAMEPAGQLVRTSSAYVDGSRVTLLDVDLDQLLGNEAVLTRLQDAKTPEDLKTALKDVPGLKIPFEREVTIEFTPAK